MAPISFIFAAKYIAATLLLVAIILAPAWVARQNNKDKIEMGRVRMASWVCGWSILAWLWALIVATRK